MAFTSNKDTLTGTAEGGGGGLQEHVLLPQPLNVVFSFFSDPGNLQVLTPLWLHFRILSPEEPAMFQGRLIDYRLRLHGIPLAWQSEITVWDPPHRFVDEQRKGPYRSWRHEHLFEEKDGGTLVTDRVAYRVPGGAWVDRLLVRRDVTRIFAYRRHKLLELFGHPFAHPAP